MKCKMKYWWEKLAGQMFSTCSATSPEQQESATIQFFCVEPVKFLHIWISKHIALCYSYITVGIWYFCYCTSLRWSLRWSRGWMYVITKTSYNYHHIIGFLGFNKALSWRCLIKTAEWSSLNGFVLVAINIFALCLIRQ